MNPHSPVIYTIGHSTRSLEEFIALLEAHGVTKLIDVRTIPRSAHNPQFNLSASAESESLPESLARAGIAYQHMPALGGLRKARADSINMAWKNASFRGYADYMQTDAFSAAIDCLLEEAAGGRVAVMCAESVPWRCHRSLIADALLARGIEARHIMSASKADTHKLTGFARVNGRNVSYPAPADSFDFT